MKSKMIRVFALLGISVMTTLSAVAQDQPKVKITDEEVKYKSDDLKLKGKKDETKYKSDDLSIKNKKDETKYKSEEVKYKEKKDETKYKSADLKIKEEEEDRKIKGKVTPMEKTSVERTTLKTGETNVRTKQHVEAVSVTPAPAEPEVAEQVAVPKIATPVKKTTTRKYARKSTVQKPVTARKPSTAPRTIVRTKIIRDTVLVPSPPEKVVTTEYVNVHDTVTVTRVDTVLKVETKNTYSGYAVPRGDFKKVKLKKDEESGEVYMKRKDKDGNIKTEKLKH